MMFKQTCLVIAGVAACVGVLTPSVADASDSKSYHASQCQTVDGIEADYNRSEYRITRTGSQGSGQLMCPVVRDVFGCEGWGGCVTTASASVRVYDATTQGQVSCSFSARNETGSSSYYSSDSTSYGLAQGFDTLTMSGGWPPGDGTFTLRCTMPTNNGAGYAKIYGYKVVEGN